MTTRRKPVVAWAVVYDGSGEVQLYRSQKETKLACGLFGRVVKLTESDPLASYDAEVARAATICLMTDPYGERLDELYRAVERREKARRKR